jgi:hypothetical protein
MRCGKKGTGVGLGIAGAVYLLLVACPVSAIDQPNLAIVCRAMEQSIVDISVEWEVLQIPPMTAADITLPGRLVEKWPSRERLLAKAPFIGRCLYTHEATFINADGKSHDEVNVVSYDGETAKSFQEAKFLTDASSPGRIHLDGAMTKSTHFLPSVYVTPLGFSVLRLSCDKMRLPLSERIDKEKCLIDETITKVGDFRAIRVDFMGDANEPRHRPYMKVYFSIDHGYTPVRYEHTDGRVTVVTVDVNSLEKVANGLWFPTKGTIKVPDEERMDVYTVNKGVDDKLFDIKYPSGTKVWDEVQDRTYTVKPTEEQLDESLPK